MLCVSGNDDVTFQFCGGNLHGILEIRAFGMEGGINLAKTYGEDFTGFVYFLDPLKNYFLRDELPCTVDDGGNAGTGYSEPDVIRLSHFH